MPTCGSTARMGDGPGPSFQCGPPALAPIRGPVLALTPRVRLLILCGVRARTVAFHPASVRHHPRSSDRRRRRRRRRRRAKRPALIWQFMVATLGAASLPAAPRLAVAFLSDAATKLESTVGRIRRAPPQEDRRRRRRLQRTATLRTATLRTATLRRRRHRSVLSGWIALDLLALPLHQLTG